MSKKPNEVVVSGVGKTAVVLMEGAAIDTLIKSIAGRSDKLAKDIHRAGVQALLHAQTYSDPRKVDALLNALHGANGPAAFKAWVEEYSPIRWNGDGVCGITKLTDKRFVKFNVDEANKVPYWTKISVQAQPLTLAKLKAMVAQLEKKVVKSETEGLIAEGENVVDMKAFVAKITAAAA